MKKEVLYKIILIIIILEFKKRNYNIIIHSPNGTGKYDFIEFLIKDYYEKNTVFPKGVYENRNHCWFKKYDIQRNGGEYG